MAGFEIVILYVKDIKQSTAFYTALLGNAGKELSPTFYSYKLESGLILELWQIDKVHPAASQTGGGGELCMVQPDEAAISRLYEKWKSMGIPFAQEPLKAVFGLTFVALDPDGHRLRVVLPPPGP